MASKYTRWGGKRFFDGKAKGMDNRQKYVWDCNHGFLGFALSSRLIHGKSTITADELRKESTPSWMKGKYVFSKMTIYEHLKGFEKEGVLIRKGNEYLIDEQKLGYVVGVEPISFKLSEIVKSRDVQKKVSQIGDLAHSIMADFRKMMRKGRYVPKDYSIHIDFKPKLAKLNKAVLINGTNPRTYKGERRQIDTTLKQNFINNIATIGELTEEPLTRGKRVKGENTSP